MFFSPWRLLVSCGSAGTSAPSIPARGRRAWWRGKAFLCFSPGKPRKTPCTTSCSRPEQARTLNWRNSLQFATTIQGWLLDTVPQQVEDLEPILRTMAARRIVTEQNMLGPVLVLREKHAIPVAVLSYYSCTIPGPDAPPFGLGLPRPRNWSTRLLARAAALATLPVRARFRRAANRIRGRYGLPPISHVGARVYRHDAALPGDGHVRVRL